MQLLTGRHILFQLQGHCSLPTRYSWPRKKLHCAMRGLFIRQPIFCSGSANSERGSIERSGACIKRWVQAPGGQSWQKGEKRRKLCAIADIQIQGYCAPGRGHVVILPCPHPTTYTLNSSEVSLCLDSSVCRLFSAAQIVVHTPKLMAIVEL